MADDPNTLAFLAVNQAAIAHDGYTRSEFLQMPLRTSASPPRSDHRPSLINPPFWVNPCLNKLFYNPAVAHGARHCRVYSGNAALCAALPE
jgi:hypothetical protein